MINVTSMKKNNTINDKTDILNSIKNSIDNSDMILITKLNNLRSSLNSDNINFKSVKNQINEIAKFDKIQNFDYLSNLLKPERAKGSKIPSQIPVPSCAFQLHNSITVSTNNSGNVAVLFNPFFLASNTIIGAKLGGVEGNATYVHKYVTSMWINNDNSLTGSASNGNWKPIDIGQTIPPVYDQYRLVSASMVVKYIGRIDSVQGVIGGAIFYDNNSAMGGQVQIADTEDGEYNPQGAGVDTVCKDIAKYGNFDYAEDSFYHSQNMTLEGVRALYFPLDNSYEEYYKVMDQTVVSGEGGDGDPIEFSISDNVYKAGFNWLFYASGAPIASNCFKIDIYCNFECLPNASFLNYMPISLTPFTTSPEEKKRAIVIAQNKPIMKAGENTYDDVATPNLFNKMIKKFDNGLPGFDKLKAYGIMTGIPGLKSGLALAGNMIASNMMIDDID